MSSCAGSDAGIAAGPAFSLVSSRASPPPFLAASDLSSVLILGLIGVFFFSLGGGFCLLIKRVC